VRKVSFSRKNFIWPIICGISCILGLILFLVVNKLIASQSTQQMASRWSKENDTAQVSVFFSEKANVNENSLLEFGYQLDGKLAKEAITLEDKNPGARLWAHTYSAPGSITVTSSKTTLSLDAIGVAGDFFLFHPLKLLRGNYFSGEDINQDYCVIDQDAAWQLFGSNNVAGQMLTVQGRTLVIAGVVERPTGKLENAAGLSKSIIYVSYSFLQEYGSAGSINHYEVLMPDPVAGFALKMVKENLSFDETMVDYVENSSRYTLWNRLKLISNMATRSMNGKAIIYPYWENLARGYEDIIARLTICMLLLFGFPAIMVIGYVIYRYRHRSFTLKKLFLYVENQYYKLRVRWKHRKNIKEEKRE